MRQLFVIALLALVGGALLAPASAQAQDPQAAVECAVNALPLTDPTGGLLDGLGSVPSVDELLDLDDELEDIEECVGELLPGFDRDFCDDCDPTFDYEEIRQIVIRFDQGRQLRQRLLECRGRRLNETQTDDSRRDCNALERVFELYISDDGSLEARRKSDASPIGSNAGPAPDPATAASRALAVRTAPRQSLRRGLRLTCRSPRAGLCRAEAIGSGALIASTVRSVPAGATARLNVRPTQRGRALLARRGRVRARVLVRVPGAFTFRTVTLTR